MSETKFTPGPWVAGGNPSMATVLDDHEGKAIYPKNGYHHIGWANIHDEEGKLDMETALANAALIAAAPSMYKLLEGLIPVIERFNSAVPLGPMAALSWIDYINDVLAKARGEKKDNE